MDLLLLSGKGIDMFIFQFAGELLKQEVYYRNLNLLIWQSTYHPAWGQLVDVTLIAEQRHEDPHCPQRADFPSDHQ